MKTEEVAKQLVTLCQKGEFNKAVETLYGENIVSVEPFDFPGAPMPREIKGLEGVRKKGQWWEENHTIHSCKVGGPFVAKDQFAATFDLDVTDKQTGKRMQMSEVAVYTVENGKIVREEFLFAQ